MTPETNVSVDQTDIVIPLTLPPTMTSRGISVGTSGGEDKKTEQKVCISFTLY